MAKEKYIERECKKHGLTKYIHENFNCYRCVLCRIDAVQRRRRKLKKMAIEYKGGKCLCCGYNKSVRALTFHHVDASKKDFGIGAKGLTRSWEKMKVELNKCVLLCQNCHEETHDGLHSEYLIETNPTIAETV